MISSLVFAVVAMAAIIFYIAFKLDEDHFLLKLFLIIFGVAFLIMIPKAAYDDQYETCDVRLINTMTYTHETAIDLFGEVLNTTFTDYSYVPVCHSDKTEAPQEWSFIRAYSTSKIFMALVTTFIFVVFVYLFWYLTKKGLLGLTKLAPKQSDKPRDWRKEYERGK